jgi:hypothetical protein
VDVVCGEASREEERVMRIEKEIKKMMDENEKVDL